MDLLHPDFSLELMRFNLLLPHWRMEHKCYNKLHSTEMCSLYIHTSWRAADEEEAGVHKTLIGKWMGRWRMLNML